MRDADSSGMAVGNSEVLMERVHLTDMGSYYREMFGGD